MKPKYKILSIDGGGIRGIIPCTILKFLEENTGNSISDMFNVIAGTSTGGIIGLGLTLPDEYGRNKFSAKDMLDLYLGHGEEIFPAKRKDILSRISGALFDKPYDASGIEGLLKEYFGDSKLKDALTNLLITTYAIEEGKPFYFSSRLAQTDENENILYREVARSTSAAPSYFKPSMVPGPNGDYAFVDGGVFANNPSILAYCEAKELWKATNKPKAELAPDNSKGFGAVVTADDHDLPFYMLSIGTAYTTCKIKVAEVEKYRNIQWAEPMLSDVFSRSVAESTHYTMQYLLPPYTGGTQRYARLNMEIADDVSQMDNVSKENMEKLADIGNNFVKQNKDQLLKICEIIG
jgi:patatin-like phospholipase/acyl hydrolase